jgi:MltA specific insert domain
MCLLLSSVLGAAQTVSESDNETPARFALFNILNEIGEANTRQWLSSLERQCRPPMRKGSEKICALSATLNAPLNAPFNAALNEPSPANQSASAPWEAIRDHLAKRLQLTCGPKGLMTGYYEPVLKGSNLQQTPSQVPLYALPSALAARH